MPMVVGEAFNPTTQGLAAFLAEQMATGAEPDAVILGGMGYAV